MTSFWENIPKPNFLHLSALIPVSKFFRPCHLLYFTNEQIPGYLKTDRQRKEWTRAIAKDPTPLGKHKSPNKTSIQWTTGSQIYLSSNKMIFGQKNFKNAQIMHNLCLIILVTITIFSDLMLITLPKLYVKLQPHSLKIFWAKVEKVQKRH